ncbi:MAG TPA: PaaI family thioesterase [Pseudomonadales bacterium]|nr:PaaI family thioesterase [Pseudomonadales bacterium]HRG51162.1 PaaI family thioesterase [Pseudomonadales bacterium]
MSTPKPFTAPTPMSPHNPEWAARRRIAAQMRALNELMLTRDLPLAQLQRVEDSLSALSEIGADSPVVHGRLEWAATGKNGSYDLLSRDTTPIAGQSNMLSPPLHMQLDYEKGEAHATVTLGWAFEGPPKCVHGGWVAALFDEFLGCAQLLSGAAGATGNLSVRYKRPTPLNKELTLFAKVKEVHGRKILMEGTLSAEGHVTASCEGLFISFAEGVLNLAERKLVVDG